MPEPAAVAATCVQENFFCKPVATATPCVAAFVGAPRATCAPNPGMPSVFASHLRLPTFEASCPTPNPTPAPTALSATPDQSKPLCTPVAIATPCDTALPTTPPSTAAPKPANPPAPPSTAAPAANVA